MSLRNALAHLTALRIPPRRRVPLVHSLHYFPWVGAAHGSINVLVFVALTRVLPSPLTVLIAVLLPAVLAGFGPWRGVLEAVKGIHTLPGHAFVKGFRPDLRGLILVASLTAVKYIALMMMSHDWRVRAILIFPILGMSAHTWAFLRAARFEPVRGPLLARRRVRAGFLSGVSLFLVFLFPLRAAFFILAVGTFTAWYTVRRRHPRTAPPPAGELTLQSAGMVTEFVETSVLVTIVIAGLVLAVW